MKTLIGSALLILMSTQSYAFSFYDLEGKYKVSSKMAMGIVSIVTIDSTGNIELIDRTKTFICHGTSEIVEKKVIAEVKCENRFETEFTIDLSKVRNFNYFKAPINSKLTGEIIWKFTKIN